MKVKIKLRILISIILVMMFILFAACSRNSQKPDVKQQSTQSEQQSDTDKVPSDLTELENNIEMIVKTLDGPTVQVKEETQQGRQGVSSGQEKQDAKKDQGGSKSKEEGQGKQGDKSQQGQEQQQGQAPSTTQQRQQPQDPMEKIVPIINKMHYQWNNLMHLAIKKGAKKALINNFDNALNSLTNTVIGKNKTNTLMAASYLYAYIPDLYSLFNPKASPEIKRIRYYSRNAILNSLTANWTQADSDIANLKSTWSLYKNALNKEQQDMVSKLDVSIYELEKVVKERNQPLTDIKGRVAFSNIEALEKGAGDESKKGSQSGGGQSDNQSNRGHSGDSQSKNQSSGGQSSVYSYIKQLLDKLLKK